MARMRTLKPEAAASETLAAIPRETRWTFSMLWTYCDDEGRAVWNPKLVKAAIYPLDDDMTAEAVEAELQELLGIGAICRYEIGNKTYLHVPSWHDHQHPNRPVPSKLPQCPKDDHSPSTHVQRSEPTVSTTGGLIPVVVDGDVVVDGGEVEAAQAPTPRKRGTRLSADWRPSDEDRTWTLERIDQATAAVELEKFRNHWIAKTGKDATKLDWGRTWRNWVLNVRAPNGRASPKGSTADTRMADALALSDRLAQQEAP